MLSCCLYLIWTGSMMDGCSVWRLPVTHHTCSRGVVGQPVVGGGSFSQ